MSGKKGFGKKLRAALELDDLIDERDALELRGASELTVREVARFLHYSENEIRLSLREYILKITGEELYCSSYIGGVVRVCGDIFALEIDRREKKDGKIR